jgi:hypothetical protein
MEANPTKNWNNPLPNPIENWKPSTSMEPSQKQNSACGGDAHWCAHTEHRQDPSCSSTGPSWRRTLAASHTSPHLQFASWWRGREPAGGCRGEGMRSTCAGWESPHGSRRRPSPPFLTLPPSRITTAALRHLEEWVGRKPKGLAEGGSRRGGKPPGGRRWRALPPFPTPPFSLIAAAAWEARGNWTGWNWIMGSGWCRVGDGVQSS